MGDVRSGSAYRLVAQAADRAAALRTLDDEDVVAALAAASRRQEPGPEASRGRRFTELLHPDDVGRARQLFRKIGAGHHETAPLRVRHEDGHHVEVEARGIPIVVDGEVTGVHGMLRPGGSP